MGDGVVGQPWAPNRPAQRFCVWCGEFVPEASRFCVGCGRFLADAGSDEPTTVLPVAQPAPPPAARATRRRDALAALSSSRWAGAVAAGLAVLLVAGVGGFLLVGHLGDRPVVQALETTQSSFGDDLSRLEGADDLEQVRSVARAFGRDLPTLQAQERTLAGSTSDLGRAGHRVVAAQVALAGSVARIADAEEEGFAWWGPLHDDLGRAEAEIASGTQALAEVDDGMAEDVVATADGMNHLERVVGEAVADVSKSNLASRVQELAAAPRTSSIREVAAAAALEGEAVRVSAAALDEDSAEAKTLTKYATAYQSLGALEVLDADHLDTWAALRAPLTSGLTAVPAADGAATGRAAVANVDTVVRRGQDAMEAWEDRRDAAVADKQSDLSLLRSYRTKMDSQLQTYSSLRGELSNWIDRVDDPSNNVLYAEGYRVLSQASSDRYVVRDAMNELDKPAEVVPAHQSLLGVIDSAIAAVDAAYEGAADAEYCMTSCFYEDTPGWQTFRSESARITAAYAAAASSWQGQVASIENSISNRPLPEKPQV